MNTFTRIRLVASAGVIGTLGWAGTFAAFSDSADSTATFTTSTVDIVVGGDAADDNLTFTALNVSDMRPGEVKFASLTAKNNGNAEYDYSFTATGANTTGNTVGLHNVLLLEVKRLAAGATCDTTPVTGFGNVGNTTMVASQNLSQVRTSASRSVAAQATDNLCFRVELPSGTGNAYQGGSSTAKFLFTATQPARPAS